MTTILPLYRDWAPTQFDDRGAFLADRGNWFVCPCSHTRDSDHLEESNWEQQAVAIAEVDPEGTDHETYSFGHWGPGGVEIAVVRPGTRAAAVAEELAGRLEDYPIIDDEDFSRREWEAYSGHWADGDAVWELARLLRKNFNCQRAADLVEEADPEQLREWYESQVPSGDYYDPTSGCYPRLRYVVDKLDRAGFARLIRRLRFCEKVD